MLRGAYIEGVFFLRSVDADLRYLAQSLDQDVLICVSILNIENGQIA